MAANLVRRHAPEEAHNLLGLSFAQFQADQGVVALEARLTQRAGEVADATGDMHCERGDVADYAELRRAVRSRRGTGPVEEDALRRSLSALRPGQVIRLGGTHAGGVAAVLSVSHRKGGATRVRVIGATRRVLGIGEQDLSGPVEVVGEVDLPVPFAPRSPTFQRQVASQLRHPDRLRPPGPPPTGGDHRARSAGATGETSDDDAALAAHPVADCPRLEEHLRAWRRWKRAVRAHDDLARQVESRGGSLRRRFDVVLELLERWGYVRDWSLTARGDQLVQVFHECDLLLAEAVAEGLLDGLEPPEVAALVSTFVYEHRSPGPAPTPWFPPGPLRGRFERLDALAATLEADERRLGLPTTRRPDPGFISVAHGWASGGDLEEVLEDEQLTPGDFVRTMKVLLDLLGQVARVANDPATAASADEAARCCLRGVVAASSLLGADDEDEDDGDDGDGDEGDGDGGAAVDPGGLGAVGANAQIDAGTDAGPDAGAGTGAGEGR
jgi:ATP-dependent RNA helicase HelY